MSVKLKSISTDHPNNEHCLSLHRDSAHGLSQYRIINILNHQKKCKTNHRDFKMDGEELVYLLQSFSKGEPEHHEPAPVQTEHKYVYGIAGIAQIFGCSIPTASRIKRSGVINAAISQVGRKITIDVDKALELANNGLHIA